MDPGGEQILVEAETHLVMFCAELVKTLIADHTVAWTLDRLDLLCDDGLVERKSF